MPLSITPNFKEMRVAGKKIGKSIVGITKNGAISLSTGFTSRYELTSTKYCLALYDPDQMILALKFSSSDLGDGSFNVIHNQKIHTHTVYAKNLFEMTGGLDLQSWIGKYEPETMDDEKYGKLFVLRNSNKIKTKS